MFGTGLGQVAPTHYPGFASCVSAILWYSLWLYLGYVSDHALDIRDWTFRPRCRSWLDGNTQ